MSNRMQTTLDAITNDQKPAKVSRYGKNFESLVGSGAWTISNFVYRGSKCSCCGRPICRVLVLKNQAHEAIKSRDPNYPFPEEVDIGIVCGPRVFTESCAGFYEDPKREWERQWKVWKHFINYVMMCVQGKDLWQQLPVALTKPVDEFLEEGYKEEKHSGNWWMVRDAKSAFFKARHKASDPMPTTQRLLVFSSQLVYVAKRMKFLDQNVKLNNNLELETINV